ELNLDLHAAKITTIGERAEDLFILTNSQGARLNEEEEQLLREKLIENVAHLAPSAQ
ncbi:hypothetical protein DX881_004070, partial [Vibrio mimicus]